MKFLKVLQKSDTQPNRPRPVGEKPAVEEGTFSHLVPNLLDDPDLRIGSSSKVVEAADPVGNAYTFGPNVEIEEVPAQTRDKALHFRSATVDPEKVNPHLIAITEPNSAYTEEYRGLRTTLLQKSKRQKLKTISVVSVAPGEGKSITALNLALLLAQTNGVRALVIDGDLRLPSLTQYLDVNPESGLSAVLDGEVGLMDAVVRLEPSGLHLLPGGRVRNDVAELISGPVFTKLLRQAEEAFDYVIIDAPPLSVFVDAKVLINQTDGTLLVVRSNYTNYKDLDRVLEALPRQRMLGVVLNQAEETLLSGKYYDHRYYQRY